MANGLQNSILSLRVHLTPDLRDFLFYEDHVADSLKGPIENVTVGTPHPDASQFPNHVLVYISPEQRTNGTRKQYRYYYAAKRQDQWKYNFAYRGWASGGKYKQYTRTYVIPRSEWGPDTNEYGVIPVLSAGDADPDQNGDMRFDDYVYYGDEMRSTGSQELDNHFVLVVRVFTKRCTLEGVRFNPEQNTAHAYTEDLLTVTEVAALNGGAGPISSVDAQGNFQEVQPLNCDWSVVRTDKAFDPTVTQTYYDYITYYWPPVLKSFQFPPTIVERLDGSLYKYITDYEIKEAYNGPTLAKYEVSYSVNPPSLATIQAAIQPVMQPTAIRYSGIRLNYSLPPCLHPAISTTETIGNSDQVLKPIVYARSFLATNYTDWPTSLIIDYDVKPYNGGYKITKITVYPPDIT